VNISLENELEVAEDVHSTYRKRINTQFVLEYSKKNQKETKPAMKFAVAKKMSVGGRVRTNSECGRGQRGDMIPSMRIEENMHVPIHYLTVSTTIGNSGRIAIVQLMLKCDNRRCVHGVGLEATGSAWQTAGNAKSGFHD
jgi:hypothetical protein